MFKNTDNFGYERMNFRLNVSHKISDLFKLSANASYIRNVTRSTAYGEEWIIEQSTRTPPIYDIKIGDQYQYPASFNVNPLARLEQGGYTHYGQDDLNGVINAELKIYKGLKITAMGAARILSDQRHTNRHAIKEDIAVDKQVYMGESSSRSNRLVGNLLLDYAKTIKKHSFTIMGGFLYEGEHTQNFGTGRSGEYPNVDFIYDVLGGDLAGNETIKISNSGGASDNTTYSLISRLTYNYDDKYLFDFNIRNDRSSVFARGRRSATFPSLSAGWRVSEEDFFKSIEPIIPMLKLRASWGLLGNDRIGNYAYLENISVNQGGYFFGSTPVNTIGYAAANELLTWETTRMFNIGADIGLFKNSLNITFDLFNNRTKDILMKLKIPSAYGAFGSEPWQNAGIVKTQGWELSINYKLRTGQVDHHFTGNLSDSWNQVISLKGTENIDNIRILREGYPIWAYYAYRTDGYFQNDAEVVKGPRTSYPAKPGDLRFIDKNGDGLIKPADDSYIQGTRDPRYTFGFSYGLDWKGFNFSMFWQGVGKRTAWLRGESIEAFHNGNAGPVFEMHKDRWTPSNPNASYPRLTVGSESMNNYQNSDFWLRDASYLRLKNVQIGYTIPSNISNKLLIKRLHVYASVKNLLTFSPIKGTGWDPEYSEGSGRIYPVTRVWAMGLDIKF
jgi:TonB-linked SusC/RagA family outer membrane protein